MSPALLALALVLSQSSDPYVRSRAQGGDYSPPACLYWTARSITWQQSTLGNAETTGDSEFTAVSRGFQTWADVFSQCGNLTLGEGARLDERTTGYSPGQTNHNLVLFRGRTCRGTVPDTDACWTEDTCGNAFDCWDFGADTIAITTVSYDPRTGVIYDADIELNADDFHFTTVDSPPCVGTAASQACVSTDVQNTVTHEAGHFIGLDHTGAAGSVMAPEARSGEISKRTLDSGSAGFVCQVYPKGKASVSCVDRLPAASSSGSGGDGGGCASAGAGPLVLGLLALLPRLRRRAGAA